MRERWAVRFGQRIAAVGLEDLYPGMSVTEITRLSPSLGIESASPVFTARPSAKAEETEPIRFRQELAEAVVLSPGNAGAMPRRQSAASIAAQPTPSSPYSRRTGSISTASTPSRGPVYAAPEEFPELPGTRMATIGGLEFPMDPVHNVPMVSQATLHRYIHPLQAVGTVPANPDDPADLEGIPTTIFRVAPGGLQEFVTSDGFRHRFDVEIVYPSPTSLTWQGRDAGTISTEVGDFAVEQLRANLENAGISTDGFQIEPFRMIGGTPARPWFLDQLVIQREGQADLMVSLNVAMRDPQYTVDTLLGALGDSTGEINAIQS